jgi:hypothetical protein
MHLGTTTGGRSGLLGYEIDEFKFPDLMNYGINLYRAGSGITYRRLRDLDLAAKAHLLDLAKIMRQEGTQETVAGLAMLLLLSKMYYHSGRYTPLLASEFAKQRHLLPDEVANCLSCFLQDE